MGIKACFAIMVKLAKKDNKKWRHFQQLLSLEMTQYKDDLVILFYFYFFIFFIQDRNFTLV